MGKGLCVFKKRVREPWRPRGAGDKVKLLFELFKDTKPLAHIVLRTMHIMRVRYLLILGVALSTGLIGSSAGAQVRSKNLSLTVGLYRDIKISKAPKHLTRDGTFKRVTRLQYNASTKMLRFIPKKPGVGTLLIKDKYTGKVFYQFTLNVKDINLKEIAKEMSHLLQDIEGIQIKILQNQVVVDGKILLPNEMSRIHSVVKRYQKYAISLVTLSPVAQVKIAQFMEKGIGNPEIHVRAINGKYFLEGMANSAAEKQQAQIIAEAYAPDRIVDEAAADKKILSRKTDFVINLIKVRKKRRPAQKAKIIQAVVHYVELHKDYTKGFRFQWTPGLGDGSKIDFRAGRGLSGALATISGTVSNLLPKLNWAKEHGHARILKSASVIVESGKKGVIESVSMVPYQTAIGQGQLSTSFKDVGLVTHVTPTATGQADNIRMQIQFNVSSLTGMTPSGPMIAKQKVSTMVTVASNQSAAIGGLISSSSGTEYNKLPQNASSNPLLSLYASKNFRKKQSQFVVFITPRLKTSASQGSDEIKRKFRLRH